MGAGEEIGALEQEVDLVLQCLEHVWSCRVEHFACTHPDHLLATELVQMWREMKED